MELVTEKAFHSQQESKRLWRRIRKLGMSLQNKRVFVFKRSPRRLMKSCRSEKNKKNIRIKKKTNQQNSDRGRGIKLFEETHFKFTFIRFCRSNANYAKGKSIVQTFKPPLNKDHSISYIADMIWKFRSYK